MSQAARPAPADMMRGGGPGPRMRSLVTLLLRIGLGVLLLNSGVTGFYAQRLGRSMGGPWGSPFSQPAGNPGLEGAYALLPYLEITTALALFLGFFTVVAAVVAAFLTLAPQLLQAVVLLSLGLLANLNRPEAVILQTIGRSAIGLNLLMAVALIWLASSGDDGWSLDALMFAPRRGGVGAPVEAGPPDAS